MAKTGRPKMVHSMLERLTNEPDNLPCEYCSAPHDWRKQLAKLTAERDEARQERNNTTKSAIGLFGSGMCDEHSQEIKCEDFATFHSTETATGCHRCLTARVKTLEDALRQARNLIRIAASYNDDPTLMIGLKKYAMDCEAAVKQIDAGFADRVDEVALDGKE